MKESTLPAIRINITHILSRPYTSLRVREALAAWLPEGATCLPDRQAQAPV